MKKCLKNEFNPKVTATANEVPHLRERICTLGNMVEGLKAQLEQKNQEERYVADWPDPDCSLLRHVWRINDWLSGALGDCNRR